MITTTDTAAQLDRYLSAVDHGADIDADALAAEIIETYGPCDIDDIDAAEFAALLARHDTAAA